MSIMQTKVMRRATHRPLYAVSHKFKVGFRLRRGVSQRRHTCPHAQNKAGICRMGPGSAPMSLEVCVFEKAEPSRRAPEDRIERNDWPEPWMPDRLRLNFLFSRRTSLVDATPTQDKNTIHAGRRGL